MCQYGWIMITCQCGFSLSISPTLILISTHNSPFLGRKFYPLFFSLSSSLSISSSWMPRCSFSSLICWIYSYFFWLTHQRLTPMLSYSTESPTGQIPKSPNIFMMLKGSSFPHYIFREILPIMNKPIHVCKVLVICCNHVQSLLLIG